VLPRARGHGVAAAARRRAVHRRGGAAGGPDGKGGAAATARAGADLAGRRVPGGPAVPRGAPGPDGGRAMKGVEGLLSLPADLGVWLLLGYVFVVLAGARLIEVLARAHFERARRLAERGFRYDEDSDHYDCPQGERLTLHLIDAEQKVAVYRAKASSCAACPLKAGCTPQEGRSIYRPLAVWAETEFGRFHQRLSLLRVGSTAAVALGGFLCWADRPGSGLLLVAFLALVPLLVREVRWLCGAGDRPEVRQGRQGAP